jgi:hypothetical protein
MKADTLVRHDDVTQEDREYVANHVLFALVTGSFEKFFRIDIALCTWLQHVPHSNFVVVTDNATRAVQGLVEDGPASQRLGVTWLEGRLPPGVKLSKKQMAAKGYTEGWIKAQFRFIQGLEALAAIARVPGHDRHGFDHSTLASHNAPHPTSGPRWFVILDDDTFLSLPALVRMLREADSNLCRKLGAGTPGPPTTQPAGDDAGGGGSNTDEPPLTDAGSSASVGDVTSPVGATASCSARKLRPTYFGERGWGGAGHVFNYAAVEAFLGRGYEPCVDRNMVEKFYASDVALRKCLPGAGVYQVTENRMSHCQATFLRERLVSGKHATSHVKRELDQQPRLLALWRMRLYYQAMYQRNRTAYSTLMDVGACAYGSCKIGRCQQDHDRAAHALFARLSKNNTVLPLS